MPDIVYGNIDPYSKDAIHINEDLIVGSGIYLDFYSDSPSLSVKYELKYKPVKKFQCPVLTNGFSYCVRDQNGKIIKQANCYSWKGGAQEAIIDRRTSSLLHYLFFLPSFNLISSFIVEIDDRFKLYSNRPHSNPIVTIGSSLVSGEGCSFPNSVFNNILVQKLDKNIVGLQISKIPKERMQQILGYLEPSFIIVDQTFVSSSELEKTTQLLKSLSNKYRTIAIRSGKRLFRRNRIGNEKTICCLPHLDEYSFIKKGLLNDRGHYILSEMITKELCSYAKK